MSKINGIDVSEYFIEVVDEGGGTIDYKVLPNSERLLVKKIFEQNQQLKRLQEELDIKEKMLDKFVIGSGETLEKLQKENEELKEQLCETKQFLKNNSEEILKFCLQIEAYQLSENEAKEIIAELEHENKELRQVRKNSPDVQEPYIYLYRKIKKQCHKLEQENKKLKEVTNEAKIEYENLLINRNEFAERANKYKQALEEIREIAIYMADNLDDFETCYNAKEKLFATINEVLNDRD